MTDKVDHILEHILDSLEKIDGSLSEIRADLARLDEKTDNLENRVDKLSHVLIEGNGRPSLVSRVDRLEVHVESNGKTADLVGSWKMAEVEETKTRWNAVKAFAPYAGAGLGIISLILQLISGQPITPPQIPSPASSVSSTSEE